jgi:hypothetical protein
LIREVPGNEGIKNTSFGSATRYGDIHMQKRVINYGVLEEREWCVKTTYHGIAWSA